MSSTRTVARSFQTRIWDYLFGNTVPARPRLGLEPLEAREVPATVAVTLFGTGVGANGSPLSDNATDPHYELVSNGGSSLMPGPTRTITADGFPIGPWVGNGSDSRWIVPIATDNDGNAAAGSFDYRTTFDLTGIDPSTVSISGKWAADDTATIYLNGVSTGVTAFGFGSLADFTLTSGFRQGLNTLDFLVENGGGPTGLQVATLSGFGEQTAQFVTSSVVFNTGVDVAGQPLSATSVPAVSGRYSSGAGLSDGSMDVNFLLTNAPAGYGGATKVLSADGNFPFPYWTGAADPAGSAWLVPAAADDQGNAPAGDYWYSTTVNVTDPANLVLSGMWAADDQAAIFVNGVATGVTLGAPAYGVMVPFSLAGSYFTAGANMVQFRVTNGGSSANPTGLRVSWEAQSPTIDPHWTVVEAPDPTLLGATKVVPSNGFPFPNWIDNDGDSQWIAPLNAASDASAVPGTYKYQTTIDLTGYDPSTAVLSGRWSADNQGVNVYLNGVSLNLSVTGPNPGGGVEAYRGYADLYIVNGLGGAAFQAGLNTLTFEVRNDPLSEGSGAANPVGLRVDNLRMVNTLPAPVITISPFDPISVIQAVSTDTVPLASLVSNRQFVEGEPIRAVVRWGDGTTSEADIAEVVDSPGNYVLLGDHVYTAPSQYAVTIDVYGGGTLLASTSLFATCVNFEATNDTYYLPHDQTLMGGNGFPYRSLIENDRHDLGTLAITGHSQPSHGSVIVNSDGSFHYNPNPGFVGVDEFTYSIQLDGVASTATVVVNVENTKPYAIDDSFFGSFYDAFSVYSTDGSFSSNLLSNDYDPEDQFTIVSYTQPQFGSVLVSPDGSFIYTPGAGFQGGDSFTYTVSDGIEISTATAVLKNIPNGIAPLGTNVLIRQIQPLPNLQFPNNADEVSLKRDATFLEQLNVKNEAILRAGTLGSLLNFFANEDQPIQITEEAALWTDKQGRVSGSTLYGRVSTEGQVADIFTKFVWEPKGKPFGVLKYINGELSSEMNIPRLDETGKIIGIDTLLLNKDGLTGPLNLGKGTVINFDKGFSSFETKKGNTILVIDKNGNATGTVLKNDGSLDKLATAQYNAKKREWALNLEDYSVVGNPKGLAVDFAKFGSLSVDWNNWKNPNKIHIVLPLGQDRKLEIGYDFNQNGPNRSFSAKLDGSAIQLAFSYAPGKLEFTGSYKWKGTNAPFSPIGLATVSLQNNLLTGSSSFSFKVGFNW